MNRIEQPIVRPEWGLLGWDGYDTSPPIEHYIDYMAIHLHMFGRWKTACWWWGGYQTYKFRDAVYRSLPARLLRRAAWALLFNRKWHYFASYEVQHRLYELAPLELAYHVPLTLGAVGPVRAKKLLDLLNNWTTERGANKWKTKRERMKT